MKLMMTICFALITSLCLAQGQYLDTAKCIIPDLYSDNLIELVGKTKVIETLYGAQYKNNEFVWKPNYEERFAMGRSDNGFLYSKVEQTFTYKTAYSEVILLIVGTYTKEYNSYRTCFGCAPTIGIIQLEKSKGESTYRLISLKKVVTSYGTEDAGGGKGKLQLIQISNNIYVLELIEEYFKEGFNEQYTTLLNPTGEILLQFQSYIDNARTGSKSLYKNETKLNIDKIKGMLTLQKKGTEMQYSKVSRTSKIVPVNKVIKYQVKESGILEALSN